MPQPLPGLSALADRYNHFVFDVWGVLHGGDRPFDGVMDTLAALRANDKRIAFLTNAPARARFVAQHLAGLGFDGTYDALVTSGEATFDRVSYAYRDARMFSIGPDWGHYLHDHLPVCLVDRIEDADVFLVIGLEDHKPLPKHYDALLRASRERGLPMLCANPDRRLLTQNGAYSWCAGALADLYEAMGGTVEWIGKPSPDVFHLAATAIGAETAASVVMIGDGLPTDIAGANAAGALSVLLTRGIHSSELGIEPGETAAHDAVLALVANAPGRPDYVMPTLSW